MAATALKSLRVDASFDASAYTRGAADKLAADARMIVSDRERGAALASADAAVQRSIPGVASLSARFIDGYGTGAQFEAIIRRIGTAVDRGMGLDRAAVLLDGAYRRFGLTADAAALVERGQASLAPVVDSLNQKYATQTAVLERNAVAARQMAEAQNYQAGLNQRLGVNDNFAGATRAGDIEAYGASLDDLRAKYNPLFAAGQQYKATLADINRAAAVGAISEKEHADAVMNTKVAFVGQVNTLRGVNDAFAANSSTMSAAENEHARLSTQAMALQHSLRSMIEQIVLGVPPTMVLTQQFSHLSYAASGPGGITAAFDEVKSTLKAAGAWFLDLLTPATAVFGGIAAAIGLAIAALFSYAGAQREVQRSLTGIGRASGATVGDINTIASQGASPLGESISEAREFASVLAATGKIGRDEIGALTKLGHDFAVTLGVDGKEAAQTLAKGLEDPVRGADELNQRLGFMDAAQQRLIANLVAQNRLAEAQRIIIAGIQSGIAGANEVTGFWSKTWNAISNAISNSYGGLGRILSQTTGIGASLEDQLAKAKANAELYREIASGKPTFDSSFTQIVDPSAPAKLKDAEAEVDRLTKKIQDLAHASDDARTRMESLRVAGTVQSFLPEIAQLQTLMNQRATIGGASEDPVLLKSLGLTQEQVDRAKAIINQLVASFKTSFEEMTTQSKIAFDAVTAFSPAAKAAIALRQAEDALRKNTDLSPEEKKTAAEAAYTLSLRQSTVALSEQARERELAARQSVASSQLDVDLIGKSIGEQTRLKADLQARQQLEQEAARNRTAFDTAQFARLQQINVGLGQTKQIEAERSAQAQSDFESQTVFMSGTEKQIAQVQKQLHGDDWKAWMSDGMSAAVRLNAPLKSIEQKRPADAAPCKILPFVKKRPVDVQHPSIEAA